MLVLKGRGKLLNPSEYSNVEGIMGSPEAELGGEMLKPQSSRAVEMKSEFWRGTTKAGVSTL